MGGEKPAVGATAEPKSKPKGKTPTPRKTRAKAPAVDADGNAVAAKPKAAAKPRGKAAAKNEVDSDGNTIETEGPPTKKRKASGAKAGKKVIEAVVDVKCEEGDEETDSARSGDGKEGEGEGDGDTMVVDEYDALDGEDHFVEQVQMAEATKVEIEEEVNGHTVVETLQAEAQTVVQ